MKNYFNYTAIFFASATLLFTSCKKNENHTSLVSTNSDVTNRSGMLVFKDETAFNETLNKLQKMSREETQEWERLLGFTSQKSMFDEIVDAEYTLLLKPYENLSDEQLRSAIPPSKAHSEIYDKYLKKGIIKVINVGTEHETYDYAVCNPALAVLINEQGFYCVGSIIYQLTTSKIKSITDGDFNKINLLSDIEVSDPDKNITVFEFKHVRDVRDWIRVGAPAHDGTYYINGKDKMTFDVYFTNTCPIPTGNCQVLNNFHIAVFRKNLWGTWVYYNRELWINGSWSAYALQFGNVSRSYSYSVHPNSFSNFYFSVDPITGAGVWPVNTQYTYLEGVGINSANWTASTIFGTMNLIK